MARIKQYTSVSRSKKKQHKNRSELRGTNETTISKNKITKSKKSTKATSSFQAVIPESENIDNNTPVSSSLPTKPRRSLVTKDQIENLINYIVKDKMSISAAARKAKMSLTSGGRYYKKYEDDPKHEIPVARSCLTPLSERLTQKKIESLINCIVSDKMSLADAAYKVKISGRSAAKYYEAYMNDPDRKIPTLDIHTIRNSKRYTQTQVDELINCIVHKKMTVAESAKKADISIGAAYIYYGIYRNKPRRVVSRKRKYDSQATKYTFEQIKSFIGYIMKDGMTKLKAAKQAKIEYSSAEKYYLLYLEDPNNDIFVPVKYKHYQGTNYTDDEVKNLIDYIVEDRMSVSEASAKANMSTDLADNYYRQYLDNLHRTISPPETSIFRGASKKDYLDRVRDFFNYIIIDKLSIIHASHKADISETTGYKYYKKYLENPGKEDEDIDIAFSPEKMKRFVEYVENDKMSVRAASIKASLHYKTARCYYSYYLKDPRFEAPIIKHRKYSQEDIANLINYVDKDKMSISAAGRKINMSDSTAHRYYSIYQKDLEHKIPVPIIRGAKKERKGVDKYAEIVADIYKNNPSIKPIHKIYYSKPEPADILNQQYTF